MHRKHLFALLIMLTCTYLQAASRPHHKFLEFYNNTSLKVGYYLTNDTWQAAKDGKDVKCFYYTWVSQDDQGPQPIILKPGWFLLICIEKNDDRYVFIFHFNELDNDIYHITNYFEDGDDDDRRGSIQALILSQPHAPSKKKLSRAHPDFGSKKFKDAEYEYDTFVRGLLPNNGQPQSLVHPSYNENDISDLGEEEISRHVILENDTIRIII